MQLRKYRWSKDYESAEEELLELIASKNITATRWHAEEYQAYPEHSHDRNKTLWCAEGSIVFTVGAKQFSVQPGDTLEIPASEPHSAAGFAGAVCYEAFTD